MSQRPKTSSGALFGDLFGQRADYSHGLFYAGHRRYLNPRGVSSLEPPKEFLSKRQLQQQQRMSAEGTSRNKEEFMKNFQVNFQNKKPEYEDPEPQKKMKRIVHLVRNTISLEHYSSVRPEDWVEEEQAGVKFWVNKVTGEASAVCPWREVQVKPLVEKKKPNAPTHNMLRRRSVVVEEPASHLEDELGAEGTGSLVYDGKELEELFAMLNTAKK